MKSRPIINGEYTIKGFEHEGNVYSAARIPDTKKLTVTDYDSNDYVSWNLANYFESDFQPLTIHLLFDTDSKLSSFVIKISIFQGDKLIHEITADKSNCQNAGREAIYTFDPLIIPANAQIRLGCNENIEQVKLLGKLAFLGSSFEAEKTGVNDGTYTPLPLPSGSGVIVYAPDEIVPLATKLESYDAARNNGIYLYPFRVNNYLTSKAVGAVFDLNNSTLETLELAFYSTNSLGEPKVRLTDVVSISTSISGFFFTELLQTFSPNLLYWVAAKYQGSVNSQNIETSSIREYTGNSYIFDQNQNKQLQYPIGTLDSELDASALVYSNRNPYQIYLQVN